MGCASSNQNTLNGRIMSCTCGPSLGTPEKIAEVIKEGVGLIRINFSHGGPEDHKKFYAQIQKAFEIAGKQIPIMGDIQGPKFRVGMFQDNQEFELETGAEFTFDSNETPGDATRVHLPHPEIFTSCKKDDLILLNDGIVHLKVLEQGNDFIKAVVTKPGPISSRKGISLPHCHIKTKFPTDRDLISIQTCNELKLPVLMLSFVQTAEDVKNVKKLVHKGCKLMPKIEMPHAVTNIDSIIKESDMILVARGDLAVEGGMPNLPKNQKIVISRTKKAGKICICATQHLESMVNNPKPTYAECNDIYNAILDGADGILLTGETANGKYPIECIKELKKILDA